MRGKNVEPSCGEANERACVFCFFHMIVDQLWKCSVVFFFLRGHLPATCHQTDPPEMSSITLSQDDPFFGVFLQGSGTIQVIGTNFVHACILIMYQCGCQCNQVHHQVWPMAIQVVTKVLIKILETCEFSAMLSSSGFSRAETEQGKRKGEAKR